MDHDPAVKRAGTADLCPSGFCRVAAGADWTGRPATPAARAALLNDQTCLVDRFPERRELRIGNTRGHSVLIREDRHRAITQSAPAGNGDVPGAVDLALSACPSELAHRLDHVIEAT
jgi:hypothetical protein